MTKDNPQLQVLRQIATTLQELLKLARVMSFQSVKTILETALDTEQKRLVYHLLDGERTVTSIQELTGVNISYISQWGQEWEKVGIVETGTRKGRRQKSFDLSIYGLSVPEAPEKDRTNDNE